MTIAPCPKCRDDVTVPASSSSNARVRCPLCQEEYLLGEILDRLPPTLVVLDAPASGESSIWSGSAPAVAGDEDEVAAFSAEGDDSVAIAEPDSDDDAPGFAFGDAAPTASTGRAIASKPRPKRKQKNPIFEVVKIVGGGVAGIVMAVLLLWWAFGKDPFKLGPKVGQYSFASWIVPAKFRPGTPSNDEQVSPLADLGAFSFSDSQGSGSGPKKGGAKQQPKQQPAKQQNYTRLDTPENLAGLDDPAADDPSLAPDLSVDLGGGLTEPEELAIENPLAIDQPKLEPDQPTLDTDQPAAILNAPEVTTQDLQARLQAAIDANDALDSSGDLPREELQRLAQEAFDALANVGAAVTFIDQNAAANHPHVKSTEELLKNLGTRADKVKLIGFLGQRALSSSEEANQGIALAGTVREVAEQGSLYQTQFEIMSPDMATIPVISYNDPRDALEVGAEVLLLGAIVKDPEINVPGYEGSELQIVCGGYWVVVGQ